MGIITQVLEERKGCERREQQIKEEKKKLTLIQEQFDFSKRFQTWPVTVNRQQELFLNVIN